jgi:hypothetical protein
MGDVTIKCGVAASGGKGQQLGETRLDADGQPIQKRGLIVCPKCEQKSMVRLRTSISNDPAQEGARIKERVYECTSPGCDTEGRQTLVKTVETSEGETVKAYV